MTVEAFAQTAHDLRGDDAGITASTHKGTVGDGLAIIGLGGIDGQRGQILNDHGQGQRHVGAGIAIGHGEDVEAIDFILAIVKGMGSSRNSVDDIVGRVITHKTKLLGDNTVRAG